MSVDKRLNDTPSGDIVAQRITANYTSISVVIQINRYSAFYVWTVILPISLVGYLGFAIFFFQPSMLHVWKRPLWTIVTKPSHVMFTLHPFQVKW